MDTQRNFWDCLGELIFACLQATTPITPEEEFGQKIERCEIRRERTSVQAWTRNGWGEKTPEEESALRAYQHWIRQLNRDAGDKSYEFSKSIPDMFFEICKELGLPAKLLIRDDLVEALSNVYLHIIQLSDDLLSTDRESPEFLDRLYAFKKIADVFNKLEFDRSFFSEEELREFFVRLDEKLQETGKIPLHEHNFRGINQRIMQTDLMLNVSCSLEYDCKNFLKILIEAIIHGYRQSGGGQRALDFVEQFCKIFDQIYEHKLFFLPMHKHYLLCYLFPWEGFTGFLMSIRQEHPEAHEYVCSSLVEITTRVQKDKDDLLHTQIMSKYPDFEQNKANIVEFVRAQLSYFDRI